MYDENNHMYNNEDGNLEFDAVHAEGVGGSQVWRTDGWLTTERAFHRTANDQPYRGKRM